MKKKDYLYFLITPLIFLLSFYLIEDWVISLLLAVLVGVEIYLVLKLKKKDEDLYHKIEVSYEFTNFMNVQMLSTTNVFEGYQAIEAYLSNEFQGISGEEFANQVMEIANNFNLIGFQLYANTLMLYTNNGGDFYKLTKAPSDLCQKSKIHYLKMKKKKRLKLVELFVLYFLWIFVLLFLKIALGTYFEEMLENAYFQTGLALILMIGYYSFFKLFRAYYTNKIRGL